MDDQSPQQQIARMLTGYWISQALCCGKARYRRPRERSSANRRRTGEGHEDFSQAALPLAACLGERGVFSEDEQHRFTLTPLADCLRCDVPGSQRAMAIMSGDLFYKSWGELLYSVETNGVAFEQVYGSPIFDFLSRHPEQAALFDQTMVGVHGRETAAMLEAYDFSGVGVLCDIGGGNGSVIISTLQKYPKMRGILFDLPNVIERAKPNIDAAGLANRCQMIGGSFFESVPSGADAYLLRHIIHDWDDAKAIKILRNIHKAMKRDGKLLLVESVIPPGNEPSFGKLLDLVMLVIPGGEERTEEEYRKLYEATAFRLMRIVPTEAEVSVIEGRKVSE